MDLRCFRFALEYVIKDVKKQNVFSGEVIEGLHIPDLPDSVWPLVARVLPAAELGTLALGRHSHAIDDDGEVPDATASLGELLAFLIGVPPHLCEAHDVRTHFVWRLQENERKGRTVVLVDDRAVIKDGCRHGAVLDGGEKVLIVGPSINHRLVGRLVIGFLVQRALETLGG